MAWGILTIKQKVGVLRCGANFVVILRDNNWKQSLAEVCEGWCAKQQEKEEGTAHPWACSKRGAAFVCVISLLNKVARAETLSAARNTESHSGWSKVGFAEMAKCKPAVWDSAFGSFKPIHPKFKEDKPWTWVATIRSDAPSQFMEQFRAMTSLHTEGVITIAAERENKQSKSEEQLWTWLKNRSKTTQYRRGECMMAGSTRSRGNGPAPGGKPAYTGDLRNSVLVYLVVDLISYGRGNNVRVLNLLVC